MTDTLEQRIERHINNDLSPCTGMDWPMYMGVVRRYKAESKAIIEALQQRLKEREALDAGA